MIVKLRMEAQNTAPEAITEEFDAACIAISEALGVPYNIEHHLCERVQSIEWTGRRIVTLQHDESMEGFERYREAVSRTLEGKGVLL